MRILRHIAVLAALTLVVSSCSDDEDGDSGGRDGGEAGAPSAIGDLSWAVPYDDTDISVCAGIAVHGPVGETPTVVDTATGAVTELAVTLPPDATLEPSDSWNYRARCQDTPSGDPVVLVEWQDRYLDPDDEPPTVYAGFNAAGTQLWVREGEGATVTTETGIGILGISVRESSEWTFVDTMTGDELGTATFTGIASSEPEPINPELIVDGSALVSPSGEPRGELPAGSWMPVGPDRILVDDNAGVTLLSLPDLQPLWTAPEFLFLGFADDSFDPTTGTIVVEDTDDRVSGLDVETGKVRWTSDVVSSIIGVDHVGGGIATFPDDEYDEIAWVDTANGELVATDDDRYVLTGPETIIAVDDGEPAVVTLDDLR